MKRARLERPTSKLALAFALLLAFSSASSAQTLADAARKERERQSRIQSTITIRAAGAGVASTTSAGTAAALPAASAAPASAQKPAGPLDNRGRDEKYWRAAFQKARIDAKRAEERAQVLDLQIKEMTTQLFQKSVIYNREYRINPEIAAAQRELESARRDAEVARQSVRDLEEELRRAGGLPGWAR